MSATDTPNDDQILAELQRKAESLRQEVAQRSRPSAGTQADAATGTMSDDGALDFRTVEQPYECQGCGAKWVAMLPSMFAERRRQVRVALCAECKERADREEEERRERARLAEREQKRQHRRDNIHEILHRAGVNVWDHRDASLENFDTADAGKAPVEAAAEFIRDVKEAGKYDPVRGLYLFGGTGAGKSHLAVAVARELELDIDYPGTVVFDHALRLIGRIQRTYSNDESADEVLDRRINAGVWILDDLGTEAPSADVVRRLTEIFTERAMRPTLVTSNLPPDKLEGRHPELFRVVSRLGPRYFRTVKVNGTDRRFRAA